MKKGVSLLLLFCLCAALLAGCAGRAASPPQVAPMQLSGDQQEIVNLLTHTDQEIYFFEFTDGVFTGIEIWVEVYHYGEFVEQTAGFHTWSDTPFAARPIAIQINQSGPEVQWTISLTGGRHTSAPWIAGSEYMARAFGPIREPVTMEDGQEILLYISRFTTGSFLNAMSDLQWYLENPEALAGYTYVHLIKARFTV